jgi:tryptophan 2,3-dioxygenase
MTYAKYLRLKQLLSLQVPLTPADQRDLADSERLFIVVHQASETLLSQVLIDLRHIEANDCGQRCGTHRARRAISLINALESHLTLLRATLRPDEFLRFRDRFGTASGLQSAQFHEMFALTDRLAAEDHAPVDRRLVDGLRDAVVRWRTTHLQLVEYMLGDLPGTGNTSGARYLTRQLPGAVPHHDRAHRAAAPSRPRPGRFVS